MRIRLIFVAFIFFKLSYSQQKIVSEDILVMNDSIRLPGTLSYNKGLNKQPLVIFVSGSGNPDRNGNQPQFNVSGNYIRQFSEALNKSRIAFFRYDKRNVTKENIPYILSKYEFQDLVSDVDAIIDNFKRDRRFNEIILIGHSQGSLVAMLAINNHIAKYISLAGLGESADKAIVRQITAQSEPLGKVAEQHSKELKNTGTIQEINPMLASLFAKQNHQFLSSYFKLDPQQEIKKVKIPFLILNGSKDIQVSEEDAKRLHSANTNSELVIIENMNHVLKRIEKDEDNLKSYYSADYPLSEQLVEVVTSFIKK